ncbi:hypothetical protein M2401_000648 [Pseudomonas sp. JUb42]|uniref:hypothetical protein n=1 Tax=Pseudomonas sp. JUb42 TaxID=2940611 RepID=UPI0021680C28|nr:hypothetical protein [Pseudomonas sp. JUb42]MCS3466938.1 hypothetical protein [Pseudomonas sp. JUb42]
MSIFFGTGAANTWQGGVTSFAKAVFQATAMYRLYYPIREGIHSHKKPFISEGYLFFLLPQGVLQ